jgi:cell wall assembly regulator SMI1
LPAIAANDRRPPLPLSIRDFGTWAPLLALLRAGDQQGLASPGGYVAGHVGRSGFGWSVPPGQQLPLSGVAVPVIAAQIGFDPMAGVQEALADAGMDGISFVAESPEDGRATLHLLEFGPAVEVIAGGIGLGSLVLVEGAVPEPWRRLPAPVRRARPAASVDLALLERTLRERLPGAVGATEAEIAAAESRLGLTLPDELKVLYRVTRARWADWGDDHSAAERVSSAVGCYPLPLDQVHIAEMSSRPCPWLYAATEAAVTPAGAAVQGLVGSPGWIVFGGNGEGERVAIDLTPGPRGNIGQVIMINHHENVGADLLARSLTALVMSTRTRRSGGRRTELPAVARVNRVALRSVEAAAGPGLEVLSIGVWEGEPLSLAPVTGLPRLRTLTALPGTLADPLEVTGLTGLEFLELGPDEWRVLLGAAAVPRTLLAAAVGDHDGRNPLQLVPVANEILALWDRPPITETILEGDVSDAL